MPRHETFVEDITVTPDPIRLGPDGATATVEAILTGGAEPAGTLAAPDGSLTRLRFAPGPREGAWRATHRFGPRDRSGLWRATAETGHVFTDLPFLVCGGPPLGEAHFSEFDVVPRDIAAGEIAVASGRLLIRDGSAALPYGGQLVSITFRAFDPGEGLETGETATAVPVVWEEIGEAVTEWRSGLFSAEISTPTTGRVRAELIGGRDGETAVSQSVPVTVAAFSRPRIDADITATSRSTAQVSGRNTVACLLHTGTVHRSTGAKVGAGSVRIEYRKPNGRWTPAKGPGRVGRAVGVVSGGVFSVKSELRARVSWRAEYT
ncbi:hypothetical protein [Nonomuraea cavernae]|uniref:Uncharacterized protein n=1 Tax=Nonomuraea cavernae TaxID=2045107 RepID=A0A917Z2H3_9ACTN|nr:hypothetical protein [Nonomuraea cavernae]MCA2188445.1 hypothetical protein [Nonomuraea cavernae]GGO73304.1 hypothetical protein GCM10012289_43380 [Nonomuraea cavernae]